MHKPIEYEQVRYTQEEQAAWVAFLQQKSYDFFVVLHFSGRTENLSNSAIDYYSGVAVKFHCFLNDKVRGRQHDMLDYQLRFESRTRCGNPAPFHAHALWRAYENPALTIRLLEKARPLWNRWQNASGDSYITIQPIMSQEDSVSYVNKFAASPHIFV